MNYYGPRHDRNEESRNRAEHHAEPWTGEEIDLLMEWNKTEEELAVIAELLGRTIEACRQRYYLGRQGHYVVRKTTTVVVTGWLVGYCFQCGRYGDVFSDGTVSLCEDCREG